MKSAVEILVSFITVIQIAKCSKLGDPKEGQAYTRVFRYTVNWFLATSGWGGTFWESTEARIKLRIPGGF